MTEFLSVLILLLGVTLIVGPMCAWAVIWGDRKSGKPARKG